MISPDTSADNISVSTAASIPLLSSVWNSDSDESWEDLDDNYDKDEETENDKDEDDKNNDDQYMGIGINSIKAYMKEMDRISRSKKSV